MIQQEPQYDVRAAARRSGVPFRTLYRWIASGILPATFTRPTLVRLSDGEDTAYLPVSGVGQVS